MHSRGIGELLTCSPMLSGNFSFRAGSPGMISNLALVVHVALHLGVPHPTLQACLDAWRPFRQRGEVIRHGSTNYYVDCYNANPGSILDSVQGFASMFPDQSHLYVLGSMKEMGPESEYWHRQTAETMYLQSGADVYLVGEEAQAMAEGLKARGISPSLVHIVEDSKDLAERLRVFDGAVFLKGSRSYGLESLLPKGGQRC